MNGVDLTAAVVCHYLDSSDFNGLPARMISESGSADQPTLKSLLEPLIEGNILSVNFGDVHPNPHIRALQDLPPGEQIRRLREATDDSFVVYPTAETLEERVDRQRYSGRPFSLMLALGAPQLDFRSFELSVIDHYRRDPRYLFWSNDITASLCIGDEAFSSESYPEKHKVLIQHFGFSFDESDRRAVAVFLTDLHGLTPEHQQIWAAYQVEGNYRLHPDFYRTCILGEWDVRASLRDAFVEELKTVDRMCLAIGWPRMFRQEIVEPPQDLAFLLRPTVDAFNSFVHTLDKLMSENINRDFFPPQIPREEEVTRKDNRIEVRSRGTIRLLEDWLWQTFRPSDPGLLEECLATFREVRRLRQRPAHALIEAEYDEDLFETQRQLFMRAYSAIRTIRLVLQNHPKAHPVRDAMNKSVRDGEIWPR